MARVEGNNRRAHLRLVIWGPPCARKSEMLAQLHAACEAPARGGRVRLEEGSNAAGQVEYAFMDLPPWDGRALRLHCLTAGDSPGLEDLRRRLLAETDAILFVAELGVEELPATIDSWQELVGHLDALGTLEGALPLAIVVDGDVDGLYRGRTELPTALGVATPRLPGEVLGVHPPEEASVAAQGLIAAAVLRAFPRDGDVIRGRVVYEASLSRRFAASGVVPQHKPTLPWDAVESETEAPRPPDPAEPELTLWMKVRESDLAMLERERALRRLLIEIGQVCAQATDVGALARAVLVRLVMNLDARGAWLGLRASDAEDVIYDSRGQVVTEAVKRAAAARLAAAVAPGSPVRLEADSLEAFDHASEGVFVPFPISSDASAWLLVTGGEEPGLAPEAHGLVASAASFVGLAAARLDALDAMRRLNHDLEERVRERTRALRRQKGRLEDRVRARTRDLEEAKRAALANERRLLDVERREGVHRLAAGMAHELNNPLAALSASLAYVGEVLEEWGPEHVVSVDEIADLREAVVDSLADASRMERLVGSLFGSAARSRRAAVRTDLGATLRDAARHAREAIAENLEVRIEETVPVFVGIPPGELTRWLFRLLTSLAGAAEGALDLCVVAAPEGPALRIRLPGPVGPDAQAAIADVAQETADAGGSLEVETSEDGDLVVELALPSGIGSVSSTSGVLP